MNIVALIGNLASDPELRHTSGGKAVANFRLAVSRGRDETDFFTVNAWDRTAEVVNEYLAKGRRVAVEGRLQHRTWEAQDGSKRSTVEVVAHRVEMLGSRDDAPAAPANEFTPVGGGNQSDDDIPF